MVCSLGDDCISIGPGTRNLWIQNVKCGPGHGISIGSLGKVFNEAGVQNVIVTNSVFTNSDNGLRIKSWARPSNGFIKNIVFQNIIMNNVKNPIIIDQNYCPHNKGCPRHDSAETIRRALNLGVNVKMITGDQLSISKETGRRLGMGTNMYPSSSLLGQDKDASIAVLPIDELIEKADGFAGVFPGMNYTLITDNLIVGSQPQKPEDLDHLKQEENVAYILNLQQDNDIEYWGIDLQSIVKRCRELGIRHMRRPARDFDPDSLRNGLPKAVSSLEWAISEGKGKVYVHCTAGLGRAPAVAIAYMFWFCGMDLNTAYNTLTSERPCGPNKRAIRGATYDLCKNDPWKEPFDNLPEHAFAGISDWERKMIQDCVRALRGT